MWNVMTVDGYFDGEKNWDLWFHETVWGEELKIFSLEQLHAADYLVFGRATYEGMAAYWQTETGEIADLMNAIPKIVCSRTLNEAGWNNSTLIRENVSDEIARLKAAGNKDMYVFGSANLSETFIEDDLFDEFRICIAPVIAGKGRSLFPKGLPVKKLPLISSQPLATGGVVLRYGPQAKVHL